MNGKKILSFLLALVMVFGIVPVSVMAAEPLDETMTAVPAAEQTVLSDAVPAANGTETSQTLTLEIGTNEQPTVVPDVQEDLSTDGIVRADEHVRYQVTSEKLTPSAGIRYTLGDKITSGLTTGTYAIVSVDGNTMTALAVEADGSLTSVTLQPGQEVPENARWTVTKSRSNYTIKNGDHYLAYETNRSGKPESLRTQTRSFNFRFGTNGFFMEYEGSWINPGGNYYFDYSSNAWRVGTNTAKAAAPYRLNEEDVPAEPIWQHSVTFYGDVPNNTATEVVIGNVRYLVRVVPEDLSHIAPAKLEYWITNARVTGIPSGEDHRDVQAVEAYGEAGVNVEDLVDPLGQNPDYEDREYWQCRLLDTSKFNDSSDGTERQTDSDADDDTESGVAFTKIRYYHNKWQVFTENGQWVTVNRNHQLIAYYLEVVNIFDKTGKGELHVNTSDWGYGGDKDNWGTKDQHCSISFQIIYESGSTNPSATTADPLAEKTIVYNWWKRRGIGTVMFDGQGRYEIDHIDSTLGMMSPQRAQYGGPITGFEWEEDTTLTVWDSNGNPQDRVSLNNTTKRPTTSGYKRNLSWLRDDNTRRPEEYSDRNNNAILLQVYVKAKKTEDTLTAHYLEGTSTGIPNEFYNFNISVEQGVTFDPGFAKGPAKNTLVNNTVINFSGNEETVKADLTQLPLIDPLYRLSNFTLQEVIRSEDGKDVYLYYTFENQRKAFVADFGLPMTFTGSDLGAGLEIKSVSRDADYGTIQLGTNSITYTPTRVIDGYESLLASVTDNAAGTGSQLAIIQIYILPASNVLYEEGFFAPASTSDSLTDWAGGSRGVSRQSAANQAAYGYDAAYASSTGSSEGTAYTASVDAAHNTENMTVTFTGNGFDLIGDSAPDTGMIMLALKGPQSKMLLIDTSHSVKELTQVPLAHVELTEGTYTATVMGGFRAAGQETPRSRMSVMSVNPDSTMTAFEKAVQQFMEEEGIETVEYINAETGMMTPVSANRPMVMSVSPAAAVSAQEGTRVAVDGFRVYRSSDSEAYVPAERNVYYTNVLDALKNTGLTAYVDNRNGSFTVGNYETMGGPQNEVYLSKGQSVALKTGLGDAFQVSLRAVEGPTEAKFNSGRTVSLNHQTEMYYEVAASAEGYVTITNNGDGLLAIGNVKHQTELLNLTEADYPAVFALLAAQPDPAEPEEPASFEPERLDVKVKASTAFGKKKCTLTVKTSADVDYITVNGQRVDAGRRQARGLKFTFRQTVGKKDTAVFEIVAYDADGNASQVHTVRK